MNILKRYVVVVGAVMSLGIIVPAFAESAPVYDADAAQLDSNDQGQDLPPPPPPAQQGAYVPPQQFAPQAQQQARQRPAERQQYSSVEERLQRMEQQIDNMQNSDSAERLNSLQDQVQTLRGLVEQLTHQLQQAQNQQKSFYTDLDKRLTQAQASLNSQKVAPSVPAPAPKAIKPTANADEAALDDSDNLAQPETPAPAKPSHKKVVAAAKPAVPAKSSAEETQASADAAAGAKVSRDQPNVNEEQEIYQTAYNMIKAKKYNEAVSALQGMLKKYPSGQFASNAHYWLGELYGLMGKNDQALTEFNAVVTTFPESPRVSDAQLKVGLIMASQSKWGDAKNVFKKIINRYPGTASARLAADNLKQIKQAGH